MHADLALVEVRRRWLHRLWLASTSGRREALVATRSASMVASPECLDGIDCRSTDGKIDVAHRALTPGCAVRGDRLHLEFPDLQCGDRNSDNERRRPVVELREHCRTLGCSHSTTRTTLVTRSRCRLHPSCSSTDVDNDGDGAIDFPRLGIRGCATMQSDAQ